MPSKKQVACHDIVPGCKFVTTAPTEEELLAQVADHAAHDHGVQEVSPELLAKVRAAVRDAE
jgi:predicted small metal-binding protein